MLDPDRKKSYGVTSALLAWFIVFNYMASLLASPLVARLIAADSADSYDSGMHITFGVVAFVLVLLRLLWWLKNDRPKAPKTMPEKAYAFSRLTLLLMYLNVLQLTVCGFLSAWAANTSTSIFAWLDLPALDPSIVGTVYSVYTYSLAVNVCILGVYILTNVYFGFRYKLGYRRLLPGVHV